MRAADAIAQIARVPIREAACPFGSYDRRVLNMLRRHGFVRVYTVDGGHAKRGAWLQPRYTVQRMTPRPISNASRFHAAASR